MAQIRCHMHAGQQTDGSAQWEADLAQLLGLLNTFAEA